MSLLEIRDLGVAIHGTPVLRDVAMSLGAGEVLGVIGEYVGRIYLEAKSRPLFVVEEIVARGRHSAAPSGAAIKPKQPTFSQQK